MGDYAPSTYGDRIAEVYDELYPAGGSVREAVERLVQLADGGKVLELGIGTGRIALPLAAAGVEVSGIDASTAMLDKLRAKAGSERLSARLGDFGRDDLGSGFALVFVAFNTLFSLPDQQSQVACFEHVGQALRPGGRFVVEAFVPNPGRFDRGQRTAAVFVGTDLVKLEATTHDPATQSVQSVHLLIREGRVETYPVRLRYAFPGELDLMARIAGLTLEARWGSWTAQPFTAASEAHISVWRLP